MTIKGLKKAAGVTRHVSYRSGGRVQISLNLETGELLTEYHVGENWSNYRDPAIKTVCVAFGPMTVQDLRSAVDNLIWEEMNQ